MKQNKMTFEESVMLDASTDLRETKDGYLVAYPRIARTGVQVYKGREVGRPDLKEVRIYRPESEVMANDAMSSLAFKPVTIEHPDEPITSKNWKDFAVGQVGSDIVRDGEFIRVPLILMDATAIDSVRGGKKQLSVGYTAMLQWGDGKTDDGEAYNAIQTAIRANHVAITHTARGGDKLRMGDKSSKTQERVMATRTIMVDGISVEMDERDVQVVERALAKLVTELGDAKTQLATAQTTSQKDIATAKTETANATALVQTKDAEVATLKQQLADSKVTAEKLDALADARAAVKQRAKALLDSVVLDKKTDAEIRKQVVMAKLGDTAKDWNDEMIAASFNTLASTLTRDDNGGVGLQHVVNVLQHSTGGDSSEKAYAEYDKGLSERWKTAGVRQSA